MKSLRYVSKFTAASRGPPCDSAASFYTLPRVGSHSARKECFSHRTFYRENDVRSRRRYAGAEMSVASGRWRTLPPLCTAKHQNVKQYWKVLSIFYFLFTFHHKIPDFTC